MISQLQPAWVYNSNAFRDSSGSNNFCDCNKYLDLIRGQQFALKFRRSLDQLGVFTAEAFAQQLRNILSTGGLSGFSMVELVDGLSNDVFYNDGGQRTAGLELGLSRQLEGGWYWIANATLLRAETRGSNLIWRRSRWDVGHIVNLTAGREWARKTKKPNKTRHFGFGGRAIWTGGGRDYNSNDLRDPLQPILNVADKYATFTDPLPDYFRLDARVYWKKNLAKQRSSIFALECQNLSGQKNVGYRYRDGFTNQVTTRYQQGPIPNLSWRVEF
jgi:outer membrane receptor protein involved in Fe transport